MHSNRRSFLKVTAGAVMVGGIARTPLFAQSLGDYPFTLGVASGDPWPDGFVIWTRLAPRPLEEHGGMAIVQVPVQWEVAEDDRFTRVVRKGATLAYPELGHSVHVEVTGLQPQRPYWYRFMTAGTAQASPVGIAKTAPAVGAVMQRLRIGVAGCNHYETGFFNGWAALAREPDLDLVFHYGDYIYEGGVGKLGVQENGLTRVRQHVGGEIVSLDDYRRRYALYKSDPDLQAAHAASAFAVSFDDHEVDNNWAGDIEERGVPPQIFVLRRAQAFQAWYEHMPVRRAQFPTLTGITAHRRLDYGRLLRLHVLDTRQYRSDQPCDDGKIKECPPEAHASSTMMGATQEAWLDEGLGNDATWNLVAQQTLVMPFDLRQPGANAPALATDTWDGYRPARARLVESIRRHGLTNVVIATGDYHKNFVGTVPVRVDAPEAEQAAVEFLATSMTSEDYKPNLPALEHILTLNPHVKLFDDNRGYQLLEFTPKGMTGEVVALDQIKMRGGAVAKRTRFAVKPDKAALEKA
jgi:alkaline phosphatase D